MNFDFKKTAVYQSYQSSRFFLFRFSNFLFQAFLGIFIISLFFVFLSFLQNNFEIISIKISALLLFCSGIFWNIYLFTELKVKKPNLSVKISDAILDLENYNLADFLSLESAGIFKDLTKFSHRKKIPIDSTTLLYFVIKNSKESAIVFFRLGIDIKKVQDDLKNYLEKISKQEASNIFSDNFKKTIIDAASISVERGHELITEKDILVALAKNNEFLKKVLVDYDLKTQDVENITLWLDSVEETIKKNKEFWSKENLMRAGSMGKDWASGYTITLDQYSTDWRDVVSKWGFKEITSHKKHVQEAEMILSRTNLSNVLIVGNSGAGRKSVVEAIAHKCYLAKSFPELNNKRVVELDMVKISTMIQDFEVLERVLDQIFSEVIASGNVILVINNLDNFVNQSLQKAGAVDISGVLSKYLSMPEFHFIGISTYEGLHRNIEQNSSFISLFRKIEIPEITEQETIDILQANALEAEYRKKVLILYPAIREIVNLTGRYMPSLPFPEKALDVLAEVVAYVQSKKEKVILPHHVAEVISNKTEIPIGKMEVKEKETLLNLENLIHQRIVNQVEAVKQISVAMRRARAGLSSKKRPMGTFLFLGPTGVGKTETSKALSQIYFGSEEKMIRIDMSEFQAIADIPRLIGAVSPVEM